jgi:hypothetical protein
MKYKEVKNIPYPLKHAAEADDQPLDDIVTEFYKDCGLYQPQLTAADLVPEEVLCTPPGIQKMRAFTPERPKTPIERALEVRRFKLPKPE